MEKNEYINSEKFLNFSGILVIILIGSVAVYTVWETSRWPFVALLTLGLLTAFSFFLITNNDALRRRVFWMIALLIVLFFIIVENDIVAILTIVWIVSAVELYGPKRAAFLAVVSMSFFLLSQIYHSGIENLLDSIISTILYSLFQIFALSVVQRGFRERKLREDTALLNRELIATRELLSQSSAQAERVRIARDLHDILGHHMTALILNLEVAKHNVSHTDMEQGKAQEKVEQALALAKLLLGDIRTAVSELREDDNIDLLASIEKLTEGIPAIHFDLDFGDAPPIRRVQLAETLLRCAQESITNVLRHSGARKCRIAMVKSGEDCILSISDDGGGAADIDPGNGIRGMQERIQSQGGSLGWEQSTEGCSFHIRLPLGDTNED